MGAGPALLAAFPNSMGIRQAMLRRKCHVLLELRKQWHTRSDRWLTVCVLMFFLATIRFRAVPPRLKTRHNVG